MSKKRGKVANALPSVPAESEKKRRRMRLFLVVTVIAVFASLLGADFLYDDYGLIHRNVLVQDLSFAGLSHMFQSYTLAHYIPVTVFSFAVDHAIAGFSPAWFHLMNILLHLGSVLLLFSVVKKLFGDDWVAFGVAFLFAVHPMHVESVAWVSERKDVLSVFFMLASWRVWLDYDEGRGLRKGTTHYFVAFAFFVLAALAKVSAVVLPVVLLLGEYLKGLKLSPGMIFRRVVEKTPFFLVALGLGLIGIDANAAAHVWLPNDVWDKLSLATYSWSFYPVKLLAPFGLSAYYPFEEIGSLDNAWRAWTVLAAPFAFLVAMFVASWAFFRDRARAYVFGFAFYTLTVLPLLTWVPVDAIVTADRYSYFSAIGLFFLAAVFTRKLWLDKPALRKPVMIAVVAVFSVFAVLALARTLAWKDSETLFEDVLEKYPGTAVAHNNVATLQIDQGRFDKAEKHLFESIRLRPEQANNHYALAILRAKQGRNDEAVALLEKVIKLEPTHAVALSQLGVELFEQGKVAEAEKLFERSVLADKYQADAWFNLGTARLARGEFAGAIPALSMASRLKADKDPVWLGRLLEACEKAGDKAAADDARSRAGFYGKRN